MTPDYELVRYQPEFRDQVIALQSHLWSPSAALNAAYFAWKYEQNPYQEKALIYLALHNGVVVGMRGFSAVQWEVGNPVQRFTGLYADDAVIAPEHRNRSLMAKLMAFAFSDLADGSHDYAFNLSASPVTLISSLSMGWRNAGPFQPVYWNPWRVSLRNGLQRAPKALSFASRKCERLLARWNAGTHQTLADCAEIQLRRAPRKSPRISFEHAPRCAAMAELVNRLGSNSRIRHVRDAQYFHWRFQNPLSRYRFLFCGGDRLEGYLVLQEYTSSYADRSFVNIVDLEASSSRVQTDLIRAVFSVVRHQELMIWTATLPPEIVQLLLRCGFRVIEQQPGIAGQCPALLVRALRGQKEDDWRMGGLRLTHMPSWDIRMIYSMAG